MSASEAPVERFGPVFWVGLVAGWAIMGFGVLTLLTRSRATAPVSFVVVFALGLLLHDLVVVPAVLAFAVRVGPRLPGRARGPLLGAMVVSGIVALVSLPVVAGFGRIRENPSLLPRSYGFGLLVVLGVVWAITAALLVVSRRRSSTGGRR